MKGLARSVAVTAVAGGIVVAALTAARPPETTEVRIVATNDVRARLRRCGCQGERGPNLAEKPSVVTCSCKGSGNDLASFYPDHGAIPERSAFLASQRELFGDFLQTDSGDLLFPRARPTPFEEKEWLRQAEAVVEVYGILGVCAFAPGELDFALGRKALEQLLANARFKTVCANLVDAKTRAPLFPARATIPFGTARVGFVGAFDPPPSPDLDAMLAREGLERLDPGPAVKTAVEALRAEGVDLVVLLAHAPDAQARALIAKAPGIDAVLCAHPEIESHSLTESEGTTVVMRALPGGGGPLWARVKLTRGGQGLVPAHAAQKARRWVEQLEEQLARQGAERAAATDEAVRRNLDEQIAFARGKLEEARMALPPATVHEVEAQVRPLDAKAWRANWDPVVVKAIDRFKDEVDRIHLDAHVLAELEAPGETPTGGRIAFRTQAECAKCHAKQNEVWSAHQHARAWESLERAGNHKDPACVKCHSIGFREPGGFAEPGRAIHDVDGVKQDYRNVQCEACHGPRADHPTRANVGVSIPVVTHCLRCHDAEHDPGFEKRFAEIMADPRRRPCVRN